MDSVMCKTLHLKLNAASCWCVRAQPCLNSRNSAHVKNVGELEFNQLGARGIGIWSSRAAAILFATKHRGHTHVFVIERGVCRQTSLVLCGVGGRGRYGNSYPRRRTPQRTSEADKHAHSLRGRSYHSSWTAHIISAPDHLTSLSASCPINLSFHMNESAWVVTADLRCLFLLFLHLIPFLECFLLWLDCALQWDILSVGDRNSHQKAGDGPAVCSH